MRGSLGRTLHDIAQILESADGSEARIVRVLERLGRIVPYVQCVLFKPQQSGGEPQLFVVPPASPEVRVTLSETLANFHDLFVDDRAHAKTTPTRREAEHLAVPLVGNDEVVGVLLVRGALSGGSGDGYTEQHLRELSIVGAHLAGYLVVVEQAKRLDSTRHQAEMANLMKDEFLALISHQLRSPLTSTLAWAHVLGEEDLDASGRARAVEAIARNVLGQAKLVDDILELACIAQADLRLALKPVEPSVLIEAAIAEQRSRAERRKIRIETSMDESVRELVVDPIRVVRVISSLLAKAIHFTPRGGKVGIRLDRVGAHARIQVIDHGNNTRPEALPQVYEDTAGVLSIAELAGVVPGVLANRFKSFRTQESPIARDFGELGVGLATVKTVVEAHGGRVRAEVLAGQTGAAFTVELPLPGVSGRTQLILAGIRVLLVDDDDDMRDAVRALLEQHGAEVTDVASAAAALAALEHSRPHVLLSDLTMPGESGYDLMRKVAERDSTLPSVALTSLGTEDDRRHALAAGFLMYLAKPVEAQVLIKAVATLAQRPLAKGSGAPIH
jgi:K+-sensing histidine kinase KdpD/ActR/RegA family two-component response regulator